MSDSERIDRLEARCRALEEECLHGQARSLVESAGLAVLLALLKHAWPHSSERVEALYHRMIREETDKALAGMADDSPREASTLRAKLEQILGPPLAGSGEIEGS